MASGKPAFAPPTSSSVVPCPLAAGRRANIHRDCRRGIAPVGQTVRSAGGCWWADVFSGRVAKSAVARCAVAGIRDVAVDIIGAHPRDVVVPPAQQTGAYSSRALDAQASTDRVRVHASTFDSVALMQWHSGHPTGQVTPSPVSASMSRMENAVVVVGAPVRSARMASDGRTGETS